MNNRNLIIVILLLILGLLSNAQKSQTKEHIFWSADRQLTWDDFQAKARKGHVASAMSDITFSVSVRSEGKYLEVFVQPSFNPKGSWVKEDDKQDELLKHEQTHFDIYEVNARKLRMELQTKKLTSANVQETVNNLIDKYGKLNVKVQERYDGETDHSIKKEKQEEWNKKIEEELAGLEVYSSTSFKVEIE